MLRGETKSFKAIVFCSVVEDHSTSHSDFSDSLKINFFGVDICSCNWDGRIGCLGGDAGSIVEVCAIFSSSESSAIEELSERIISVSFSNGPDGYLVTPIRLFHSASFHSVSFHSASLDSLVGLAKH